MRDDPAPKAVEVAAAPGWLNRAAVVNPANRGLAEVLPVGVSPVTTALTVLRYGTRARAQARLADGQTMEIALAEVASYVDERRNPENRRGVAVVEVFLPTPLLASGLCLVDTPGLGSVFAANAAVTRAFVPQVDAALIVLGTDPITGEEADLVTGIVREVGDPVVIVLDKADRAAPAELQEARRFTREILEGRLQRTIGPILDVSARERLSQDGPGATEGRRSARRLRRHRGRRTEVGASQLRPWSEQSMLSGVRESIPPCWPRSSAPDG